MARRSAPPQSRIESRVWSSAEEIDRAIAILQRRIAELAALDIPVAKTQANGADDVAISNVREAIREVFGQFSPEFSEHEHIDLWAGPLSIGMSEQRIIAGTERGRNQVVGILNGLIGRLREKREQLSEQVSPTSSAYLSYLNLHPRIADVATDLLHDGYHWEAVFAAAKALVNYVKERSGRHDLDGAPLVRAVFSRNNPLLAFND
jgi:hypothetical protein